MGAKQRPPKWLLTLLLLLACYHSHITAAKPRLLRNLFRSFGRPAQSSQMPNPFSGPTFSAPNGQQIFASGSVLAPQPDSLQLQPAASTQVEQTSAELAHTVSEYLVSNFARLNAAPNRHLITNLPQFSGRSSGQIGAAESMGSAVYYHPQHGPIYPGFYGNQLPGARAVRPPMYSKNEPTTEIEETPEEETGERSLSIGSVPGGGIGLKFGKVQMTFKRSPKGPQISFGPKMSGSDTKLISFGNNQRKKNRKSGARINVGQGLALSLGRDQTKTDSASRNRGQLQSEASEQSYANGEGHQSGNDESPGIRLPAISIGGSGGSGRPAITIGGGGDEEGGPRPMITFGGGGEDDDDPRKPKDYAGAAGQGVPDTRAPDYNSGTAGAPGSNDPPPPPPPPGYPHRHHGHHHKKAKIRLRLSDFPHTYIEKNLKLPPIKLKINAAPRVKITTGTKDPLEKKPIEEDPDMEDIFRPPEPFNLTMANSTDSAASGSGGGIDSNSTDPGDRRPEAGEDDTGLAYQPLPLPPDHVTYITNSNAYQPNSNVYKQNFGENKGFHQPNKFTQSNGFGQNRPANIYQNQRPYFDQPTDLAVHQHNGFQLRPNHQQQHSSQQHLPHRIQQHTPQQQQHQPQPPPTQFDEPRNYQDSQPQAQYYAYQHDANKNLQQAASNSEPSLEPIEQQQEQLRKQDLLISSSNRQPNYKHFRNWLPNGKAGEPRPPQYSLQNPQYHQSLQPAAAHNGPRYTHRAHPNAIPGSSSYSGQPGHYPPARSQYVSQAHGPAGITHLKPKLTFQGSPKPTDRDQQGALSSASGHHGHGYPSYSGEKTKEQIEEEAAIYVKSKDEYAEDRPQIILNLRPKISISHANATHPEPKKDPRDKNPFLKLLLNPEFVNVTSTTPEYDDDYHAGGHRYKPGHGYGHGYGHHADTAVTTSRPSTTTKRVSVTTTEKNEDYDYGDETTTATTEATTTSTTSSSDGDDDSGESTSTTTEATTTESGDSATTTESDDDDEDTTKLTTTTKVPSLTSAKPDSDDDDDDDKDVSTESVTISSTAMMRSTETPDEDDEESSTTVASTTSKPIVSSTTISTTSAASTSSTTTTTAKPDDEEEEEEDNYTSLMKRLTTTPRPGAVVTTTNTRRLPSPSPRPTTNVVPAAGPVSGTDDAPTEEEDPARPITTDKTTTSRPTTASLTTLSSKEEEEEEDEDDPDAIRRRLTTSRPAVQPTPVGGGSVARLGVRNRSPASSIALSRGTGTVRSRTIRSTTEHSEEAERAEEEVSTQEPDEQPADTNESNTKKPRGRNQTPKPEALHFPIKANETVEASSKAPSLIDSNGVLNNDSLLNLLREMNENVSDLMRLQTSTACPEVVINGERYRLNGTTLTKIENLFDTSNDSEEQENDGNVSDKVQIENQITSSGNLIADDQKSDSSDDEDQAEKSTEITSAQPPSKVEPQILTATGPAVIKKNGKKGENSDNNEELDEESDDHKTTTTLPKTTIRDDLINSVQLNQQKLDMFVSSKSPTVSKHREMSVSTEQSKGGRSTHLSESEHMSGYSTRGLSSKDKTKPGEGKINSSFEAFNERTQTISQSSTESTFSFGDIDLRPKTSLPRLSDKKLNNDLEKDDNDEDEADDGVDGQKHSDNQNVKGEKQKKKNTTEIKYLDLLPKTNSQTTSTKKAALSHKDLEFDLNKMKEKSKPMNKKSDAADEEEDDDNKDDDKKDDDNEDDAFKGNSRSGQIGLKTSDKHEFNKGQDVVEDGKKKDSNDANKSQHKDILKAVRVSKSDRSSAKRQGVSSISVDSHRFNDQMGQSENEPIIVVLLPSEEEARAKR